MNTPRIEEAIADVEACESTRHLEATIQRLAQAYGFSACAFVDAGDTHSREPFYFSTASANWERTYADNQFVRVDPCVQRARRTNTPFTWSDVQDAPVRRGPKSGSRRLMDAATDFGFTEGLVVPCHFRDRLGNYQSASSVFFWQDAQQRFRFLLSGQKFSLHMLMIYFIQRFITLRAQETASDPLSHGLAVTDDAPALSDREKDVLCWAARGKTSAEIAEILELSVETVERHFKNAIRKLGATTRTQAVAKALLSGLIDI